MRGPLIATIGVLSFVPILFSVYTAFQMVTMIGDLEAGGGSASPGLFRGRLGEILEIQLWSLGFIVPLLVFFGWHLLVKRAGEDGLPRVMWGVGLVCVPALMMPLYWYFELVERSAREAAGERRSAPNATQA